MTSKAYEKIPFSATQSFSKHLWGTCYVSAPCLDTGDATWQDRCGSDPRGTCRRVTEHTHRRWSIEHYRIASQFFPRMYAQQLEFSIKRNSKILKIPNYFSEWTMYHSTPKNVIGFLCGGSETRWQARAIWTRLEQGRWDRGPTGSLGGPPKGAPRGSRHKLMPSGWWNGLAVEANALRFKALKRVCGAIITNDFDLIMYHRLSNWLLRETLLLRSKSGKNLP